MSQTVTTGVCPTGWSTTRPTDCAPTIATSTTNTGCGATFSSRCSSNGSKDVDILIDTGLNNVQIQNGTTNTQISTCSAVTPNPFTVNANDNDVITVTGYCGDPVLQETYDQTSTGTRPSWASAECGGSTIHSTTKVIFFYDTSSLGAGARTNMYTAANQWIKNLQASNGFTGEVYHIQLGGERWVLWPAWLADNTIDINGINNPTNQALAVCGVDTTGAATDWDANEAILSDWNSDSNSYVQVTGSQRTTKAMPAQLTSGEDVVVVIFCDESAGDPNNYTTSIFGTGTAAGNFESGSSCGGSACALDGGYHYRTVNSTNTETITWAQAYYNVNTPACYNGGTKSLWALDYDTAVAKISAHNAGTGNIKTFVYPSQPSTGTPGTHHRTFPLHVWGVINSGASNTGLLAHGSAVPVCNIADLSQAVQNSGGTLVNPYITANKGRLDQHGFGANVECKSFTEADFANDLNSFLSLNQTTCDGNDCAAILVTTQDGVAVANETVKIGTDTLITNASGYTSLQTGLKGDVLINDCYTYTFSGACLQHLFRITKTTVTHTVDVPCVMGCTDPTAMNYNPNANVDDGNCEYCTWGCTDPLALNYSTTATCDDGSCWGLPNIVECVLDSMAKEILKECHTDCGEPEKLTQLEHDFREMEAVLAQIYMLIDCGKIDELKALYPMIQRLMDKYQCDSCYNYQGTIGDTTTTQTELSGTICGAQLSGPCDNLLLAPSQDALQISYQIGSGGRSYASLTSNTNIGDASGNSVNLTSYCGPLRVDKSLLACGLESIPDDANVYCFYDVTSTCPTDIANIINAVELWYKDTVIANPSFDGDVFHIPVNGEKWLACGEYPYDQKLILGTGSLCNSVYADLQGPLPPVGSTPLYVDNIGNFNCGYSTAVRVDVLDRSTIGTTHTMINRSLFGPKTGTATYNDIATDASGGAIPYLRAGGSYTDQGLAEGSASDSKAVVLCFFDESSDTQAGGAYHDYLGSVGFPAYHHPPVGDISDFGNSPLPKWKIDYDSFVAKHSSYSFFKGFLFPVLPGVNHTECLACDEYQDLISNPSGPHNAKMSFVLNSLAGIHKGVWNTSIEGPVPVNPVISNTLNTTMGLNGNLGAVASSSNPYVLQGYDGLSDYGWGIDPTLGVPGTSSTEEVFLDGQFATTLDSLIIGSKICNGTDCLTVIVKDATTGAVIADDTYTQSLTTVSPGTHQILDPTSNVTVTTLGECSEYIVTVYKDAETYTGCAITTTITCGCGGDPSIVIAGTDATTEFAGVSQNGETSYGTIKNETTGVQDDLIFDPDTPGPLLGSITLDKTLKNSSFFKTNTEIPDGRYKITLNSVDGVKKEYCFLILCDSYSYLLDAYERYTLAIECCPKCTAPYDAYEKCYTLYRVLKVTGIDCGLEPWIDKAITNLQKLCSACAATAKCNETC